MDYFIGQILLFPYNFTPVDFHLCDGSTLSIGQFQALYSLIGTTYGGDGRNTFNLPNLQGAEPIKGLRYFIVVDGGEYPQRP